MSVKAEHRYKCWVREQLDADQRHATEREILRRKLTAEFSGGPLGYGPCSVWDVFRELRRRAMNLGQTFGKPDRKALDILKRAECFIEHGDLYRPGMTTSHTDRLEEALEAINVSPERLLREQKA